MTMGQPLRMPPPPRREIAGAETCRAPAQVTWNARRLGRAADGARAAALGAGVPASVVEADLGLCERRAAFNPWATPHTPPLL